MDELGTFNRFSVGLTGGIGSGKSTVADLFAEQGAAVVDTDLIAHQLTAPDGAAIPAIRAAFGAGLILPDGAMDRAAMRERVFADPNDKKRLEAILFPLIRQFTRAAADQAEGPYLLFVVPLLVESGLWQQRVSRVLTVDCPEEVQIRRVMQRNKLSEQQVRAIIASQASRAERLAAANDVINNEGDSTALLPQVLELHRHYLKLAQAE
ncbi:dephospho-CoA kinase [Herminiimonas sp. KBW02]|uniref:dephospho-CoA kinase n=1 Tax=Herminiimonas sp. KBW02 TaxID=2153363 RepID=UPI000F58FBA3|nr:dephospho-CoA kinase [Herminiimonas sp. KBW02]RQO34912.1 dephospho-CoA kinase [Herminiimonas sp. KBW02]